MRRLNKVLILFNSQEIFHSATHWLQASGIYEELVDPYLNSEPLIPLPKVRVNEALSPEQLIMLWLIWACGIILGILAFFFELIAKVGTCTLPYSREREVIAMEMLDDIIYPRHEKHSDRPKKFRPKPKKLNLRRARSAKNRNWTKEIISAERTNSCRKRVGSATF